MIQLTESALKEVKRLMAQENRQNLVLRLGVRGGGCSGFSYAMGFDPQLKENDQLFEQEGVKIACDPKSYLYLNGLYVDYQSGLTEGGFRFINPNAKGSCGCGSSFSV